MRLLQPVSADKVLRGKQRKSQGLGGWKQIFEGATSQIVKWGVNLQENGFNEHENCHWQFETIK